jgi:proteasome lid subunit RPN8/RPN11
MTSTLFGEQLLFEPLKSLVETHKAKLAEIFTPPPFGCLGKTSLVAPFRFPGKPYEYKVMPLRECPTPEDVQLCDTPDKAASYWHLHVAANPYFNPECECFSVLLLNTRRRVKGHQLVSIGTLDTILVHPREVFRLAFITAAAAIVLTHNHPSGDATPSEADIKVTRDLARAGQLLKIEVIDHIIMGNPKHVSLRELGYFSGF